MGFDFCSLKSKIPHGVIPNMVDHRRVHRVESLKTRLDRAASEFNREIFLAMSLNGAAPPGNSDKQLCFIGPQNINYWSTVIQEAVAVAGHFFNQGIFLVPRDNTLGVYSACLIKCEVDTVHAPALMMTTLAMIEEVPPNLQAALQMTGCWVNEGWDWLFIFLQDVLLK